MTSDQFSLFPPPPPPARGSLLRKRIASDARSHTIFFGLRPTVEVGRQILGRTETDKSRLGIRGKAMDADRLHVTLYAMANYAEVFPERQVERWLQAAATLRAAPFDVAFDRLAPFGRDGGALALKSSDEAGVGTVHRFRQLLGATLAEFDATLNKQGFEPHMTVSYGEAIPDELAVAPIRWTAHELVLIDSHVGKHIHEVLGDWPLRA